MDQSVVAGLQGLAQLPVTRVRLHYRARAAFRTPPFAGSCWRGALGHVLRAAVCETRLPDCDACPRRDVCLYPELFAPESDAGITAGQSRGVPPYVLRPLPVAPRLEAGEPWEVDLTLLGRMGARWRLLAGSLVEAGRRGIGGHRGQLDCERVVQEDPPGSGRWHVPSVDGAPAPLPPPPPLTTECLSIHFETPLRLKARGNLVRPPTVRPADLLVALLRRASLLHAHYGAGEPALDYARLKVAAEAFHWQSSRLQWLDQHRHSSRQGQSMPFGGIVGEASLVGPGLDAWWPLLWMGQWIGVGKGVTMGLGGYRALPTTDVEPAGSTGRTGSAT